MTASNGHRSTEDSDLTSALHRAHAEVTGRQRHLLEIIAECDEIELWRHDGARDTAQWLAAHLGISRWAAGRYVTAAQALARLPVTREVFETGSLSLDKVLELCRFATPETERRLLSWAQRVSPAAIRRRADVSSIVDSDETTEADRTRYLRHWSYDGGRRVGLEGSFAADQGALVIQALDRLAGRLPQIVSDYDSDEDPEQVDPESCLAARRADALVALASAAMADDHDPDRATVVVHAELSALLCGGNAEVERGPVIPPATALRLACDCRLQVVLEDPGGHAVGIGRTSRIVPRWLARQLLKRDRGCTFPGCEATAFLHAHHIVHWIRGGRTDLDNLVLLCSYHHKLVHEYGWWLVLAEPGTAIWYRPSGRRYDPAQGPDGGRAPPVRAVA